MTPTPPKHFLPPHSPLPTPDLNALPKFPTPPVISSPLATPQALHAYATTAPQWEKGIAGPALLPATGGRVDWLFIAVGIAACIIWILAGSEKE